MNRFSLLVLILILASLFSCKEKKNDNSLLFLGAAALASQATVPVEPSLATVKITGIAKDANGAAIANGTVNVGENFGSRNTPVTTTANTDQNGNFTIFLKIGSFKVTFRNAAGEEVGSLVLNVASNQTEGITISSPVGVSIEGLTATAVETDGNTVAPKASPFTYLLGGAGVMTRGHAVAIDANGNIYFIGQARSSLEGQTPIGNPDGFVIKYNSVGVVQWAKFIGVTGNSVTPHSVSIDSNGNVYVAGQTFGALHGETKTSSFNDTFLVKFNTSGDRQWTRLSGVSGNLNTLASKVTIDSSGNVYVVGQTWGSLDGQTLNGQADAYLIKYDSNGNKQWTRLSGVTSVQTYGRGVVTDSTGNIYITGETGGAMDGETFTAGAGKTDSFLIKYNSSGTKQWTRLAGGTGSFGTTTNSVTIDSSGNLYLAGSSGGALTGETLTGLIDLFIMKYDSNGNRLWTKLAGVNGVSSFGRDIVIGSNGKIYLTGETGGGLDGEAFNGGAGSNTAVYVREYDLNGNRQSTKLIGVSGAPSIGLGIALSPNGLIYVAGVTEGNFDGQTIKGTHDAFLTNKFSTW